MRTSINKITVNRANLSHFMSGLVQEIINSMTQAQSIVENTQNNAPGRRARIALNMRKGK